MKYKKRLDRLVARVADWKKTIDNLRNMKYIDESIAIKMFHKPGSMNK